MNGDYIEWFWDIELTSHPWNKLQLAVMYNFFKCNTNLFANILIRIFVSKFMMDIGLQASGFVLSLSDVGIKVSYKLGSAPSSFIFWKRLCTIAINSSETFGRSLQ